MGQWLSQQATKDGPMVKPLWTCMNKEPLSSLAGKACDNANSVTEVENQKPASNADAAGADPDRRCAICRGPVKRTPYAKRGIGRRLASAPMRRLAEKIARYEERFSSKTPAE